MNIPENVDSVARIDRKLLPQLPLAWESQEQSSLIHLTVVEVSTYIRCCQRS